MAYRFGAWHMYSIDRMERTEGVDWFTQQELSESQLEEASRMFADRKPEIVVSHDCPESVRPEFAILSSASRTNRGLQRLLETHSPSLWVFGHHHISLGKRIGRTLFICLGELAYLDLDDHFRIIGGPCGGRPPAVF